MVGFLLAPQWSDNQNFSLKIQMLIAIEISVKIIIIFKNRNLEKEFQKIFKKKILKKISIQKMTNRKIFQKSNLTNAYIAYSSIIV